MYKLIHVRAYTFWFLQFYIAYTTLNKLLAVFFINNHWIVVVLMLLFILLYFKTSFIDTRSFRNYIFNMFALSLSVWHACTLHRSPNSPLSPAVDGSITLARLPVFRDCKTLRLLVTTLTRVTPISQLRFDYDTTTIRRYHDAIDYDGSDRNYDMRSIRLRYDYDPTTTYRARLLPFDASKKMNMSVFRRNRVVVVS